VLIKTLVGCGVFTAKVPGVEVPTVLEVDTVATGSAVPDLGVCATAKEAPIKWNKNKYPKKRYKFL